MKRIITKIILRSMILLAALEMGSLVTYAWTYENTEVQHYSEKEESKKEESKKPSLLSSIAQLRKDLKKVR